MLASMLRVQFQRRRGRIKRNNADEGHYSWSEGLSDEPYLGGRPTESDPYRDGHNTSGDRMRLVVSIERKLRQI
jgi:hypothetical protein